MVELELHGADGYTTRLQIAAAGSRSYAFLIDWHIRVILAFAWWLAGTFTFALVSSSDFWTASFDLSTAYVFTVMLPTAALYFLYHPVLEVAMQGRTPGKRMAGVRLVDRNGSTPGAGALLVRNIFRIIDSIPGLYIVGLLSVMVTREHLRIGDLAAGTVLVFETQTADEERALISTLGAEKSIDPALRELILDLTQRWEQLQPERRQALAKSLLARLPGSRSAHLISYDDDSLLRLLQRHV